MGSNKPKIITTVFAFWDGEYAEIKRFTDSCCCLCSNFTCFGDWCPSSDSGICNFECGGAVKSFRCNECYSFVKSNKEEEE